MRSSDLKPDTFFTTNGKDIWRLKTWFNEPSCTLENIEDATRRETFGMGGHTARSFHRIEMPKIPEKNI